MTRFYGSQYTQYVVYRLSFFSGSCVALLCCPTFYLLWYTLLLLYLGQINDEVILLAFRCKPGYYALSAEDPQGCLACFCYGHSDTCSSSPGYSTRVIHSEFNSGLSHFPLIIIFGAVTDLISLSFCSCCVVVLVLVGADLLAPSLQIGSGW